MVSATFQFSYRNASNSLKSKDLTPRVSTECPATVLMSISSSKSLKKVFFPCIQLNIFSIFLTDENLSDTNVCIEALDVPVNAVATALKDFFSKRLPPLFDKDVMAELEDIAGKSFALKFFYKRMF